jgi:methyl-accepting chemotaxis protein
MKSQEKPVTLSRSEYERLLACGALVERFVVTAAKGTLGHRLTVNNSDPQEVVDAVRAFNHLVDQVEETERRRIEGQKSTDLVRLKDIVAVSMFTTEIAVGTANILTATTDAQLASATMAGAVDELAASVRDIENSAHQSAESTAAAQAITGNGLELVEKLKAHVRDAEGAFDSMVDRTKNLETRVASLGGVVDTISTIAEQTNLLALNATIEAARAGELGKGFGVVASEVKALSRQTRTATDAIRDQIEGLSVAFKEMYDRMAHSKERVQTVLGSVDSLSHGFGEMSEGTSTIANQVSSLASILTQQRSAVESLAQNMATMKVSGERTVSVAKKLDQQGRENLTLIERMRADQAGVDLPNRDVYLAKADHVLWKKYIIDFALGSTTDLTQLKNETDCRLGRWLAQDDHARFRSLIALPHRRVHEEGLAAAKCFLHRQPETGFEHFAKLESASADVLRCLDSILEGLSTTPSDAR